MVLFAFCPKECRYVQMLARLVEKRKHRLVLYSLTLRTASSKTF